MRFDLDVLATLASPPTVAAGAPLLLSLDDIDEDPDQPRREFDAEALQQLAETIAARGIKQPVSVRPHPSLPGRWLLNFGARRLRASRIAGRTEIPAFVDQTADTYDQIIENEQREALTPLELALFVQRRLRSGESHAHIARQMGKSPTLITMVSAMIDPPDWLTEVYRSGQCRGIAELYDLRRLHETQPQAVGALVASGTAIARSSIQSLKERVRPLKNSRPTVAIGSTDAQENTRAATLPHAAIEGHEASSAEIRAEAHCAALEQIIDQMKTNEPSKLLALRCRLTALVER